MEQRGRAVPAYINPYVASDKDLCEEAAKRGYLAKDVAGGDYLVEFGEFYGGVVESHQSGSLHLVQGSYQKEHD
ncbi:hypothetical protein ACLB1R_27840 [Escherichia coli]